MALFQIRKISQLEELVDKIEDGTATKSRIDTGKMEVKTEIEAAIDNITYSTDILDPEDATTYHSFHNPFQEYKDITDYNQSQQPEIKIEQTATQFHIGSGIKKIEYDDQEYSTKRPETKEEQEAISAYEVIQLVQDHIGESVIRSGRQFLAEDRERVSNFINCDPRGKTMLLFAQATAKIPSGDYQVPMYN